MAIDDAAYSTGMTGGDWEFTGPAPGFDTVKSRHSLLNGSYVIARCFGPDRHHNAQAIAELPKVKAFLQKLAAGDCLDFQGEAARLLTVLHPANKQL